LFVKAPDVIVAQLETLRPVVPQMRLTRTEIPTTRIVGVSEWGRDFTGLTATDLKNGVSGTHWRSRDSLGGALAMALSRSTGRRFSSWAVYRRADVHIAMPDRFREANKVSCAKFALELAPDEALSGFYCEKPDQPMDTCWDWLRLEQALSDVRLQQTLTVAMKQLGLHWRLDPGDTTIPITTVIADHPLLWQAPGSVSEAIGWDEFLARLRAWPQDRWLNLYLGRVRTGAEAISLGAGLAAQLATEYAAVLPLYDACTTTRTPPSA